MRLRVPAVLAFTLASTGCNSKKAAIDSAVFDTLVPSDAAVADAVADTGVPSDACMVLCVPDGTDAGVCPTNPYECVSDQGTCPGGCTCTAFCMPEDAGITCPTCASPSRECPPGCGTPLG